MAWLDRINDLNPELDDHQLRPWFIQQQPMGWITPTAWQQWFKTSGLFVEQPHGFCLNPTLNNHSTRSAGLAQFFGQHRPQITGWRDELLAIVDNQGQEQFQLERACAPYLGVRTFGVHINALVKQQHQTKMWIAKRSASKSVEPGKWDQLIAGGQPAGLSLMNNVIKESFEEAGVPKTLACHAHPVGIINYFALSAEGFKPDVIYCYDLVLPADFTPINQDGEVAGFELWPLTKVAACIAEGRHFKMNSALVILDYLLRCGAIEPSHQDYLALCQGLRPMTPRFSPPNGQRYE